MESNIWKVYQSRGLQVLGVSLTLNPAAVKTWGENLHLTYPLLIDKDYIVWGQYGMGYIPHNAIIDPGMTVRYTAYGYYQSKIIETIEQYLPSKEMVNDDFSGKNQSRPVLAATFDGSFVTAWVDQRNAETGIYAQRFNNKGEKISGNFKVNDISWDSTSATPELVDVAMDDNGNFIVVWENKTLQEIFAQRYDSEGNRMGNNFKIDFGHDPDITLSSTGAYVVVFRSGYPVKGKRYTSLQDTVGQVFTISKIMEYHRNPAVAMASDGSFLVTWEAEVTMGVIRIYAQRYDANGNALGKNFRVDDDPGHFWKYSPAIAIAPDKSFFIVWDDYRESDYGIFGQLFNSEGIKQRQNFKINDTDAKPAPGSPAIAVNSYSDYIVSWQDYRNGNADIYTQQFYSNGTLYGDNYKVNSDQNNGDQISPDVAYLTHTIIHVWQGNQAPGQDWNVFSGIGKKTNRTIHVPNESATIQEAIDQAASGDTILVAPGSYDISTSIINNRVNHLMLLGSHPADGGNVCIIQAAVNPGTYHCLMFKGVSGCKIEGFEITRGIAGIVLDSCRSCVITRNYIHDNDELAAWHGNGIGIFHCENIDITYNIIDWHEYHGIEMSYANNHINILNNTIVRVGYDVITLSGPNCDNVTIKNNIIAYSNEEGIELAYLTPPSPINFINDYNCIWQNTKGPIASPYLPGPHTIQADPMMVDVVNHNYYLQPGSPCLGAGENGANIGALGVTATGVSDIASELPAKFELSQNYPNPFNTGTRFNYQLAEKSQVTIKIFNLLGQEIRTLVDTEQAAGYYTIDWDGKDNAGRLVLSGIYLYQIQAGNHVFTNKMVILK